MNTLCLCMIVKNESKILKRCLDSIYKYIDYWIISDTGSTDGTQELIKNYFDKKNIKGELYNDKWVNFGHNRSINIARTHSKADFTILLDADFIVNILDTDFKNKLVKDNTGYLIKYTGNCDFRQVLLVSNHIKWKYVGVTHEYIHSDEQYKQIKFDLITITHLHDGENRKDKFKRDIELLIDGLKKEPENSRYLYYLANSYRDFGDNKNAVKYYKRRIEKKDGMKKYTIL